jgi:hypothetical protein
MGSLMYLENVALAPPRFSIFLDAWETLLDAGVGLSFVFVESFWRVGVLVVEARGLFGEEVDELVLRSELGAPRPMLAVADTLEARRGGESNWTGAPETIKGRLLLD